MARPVLHMPGIGAEPPAAGTRVTKLAHAALDLQGQQAAADVLAIHDLGVRVNAVILGGLLAEDPPQLALHSQPGTGHRSTADLGRRLAAHHELTRLHAPGLCR
jgi:hypothetical protein